MFCALSLYFYIESSPSMHFVYFSGVLWFSPSPKNTHVCALVLPHFFLLFFHRFRLILGTASPWVGSEFSCLWSCFPRRWLTIDSPSHLGFQDVVFGDLTSIAWVRLHDLMISFCLPFDLCFLISLQLSSLLASLWFFLSPCLSLQVWLVFSSSMLCKFGRLFLVSSLGSGFSGFGFRSPSLRLFSSSLASLSLSVRY